MEQNLERIQQIVAIDDDLNRIQDLDLLLEKILSVARKTTNADAGSIYVRNGDQLDFTYSQNETMQKTLEEGQKLVYSLFSIPISEKSISGYSAKFRETLNIPDMYAIPESRPYSFNTDFDKVSGYKTVSSLTLPLVTNTGNVLGVLQLLNARDSDGTIIPFAPEDEPFAEHFASIATVAMQRAQMTRTLLLRMIKMAELRDPTETGSHVNRVAGYAVEIYDRWARNHDVPEPQREKTKDILRMAAMLHDVGKVAISDLILKKPGRFNAEERTIMQSHSYLGAQLFADRESEFDEIAAEVAVSHHEFFDGSGYPGFIDMETGAPTTAPHETEHRGKRGEEIPLMGRIVSVADVYDALSSTRVYKKAWTEEDVIEEIKAKAGTQFDPEVVDTFIEVLPVLRQIQERYPMVPH